MRTYPALNAALAKIALTFGRPNGNALRYAKQALSLGASHPMPRARYAVLACWAADCRYDLAAALIVLDRHIPELRRRLFTRMSPAATSLEIEIAKEARLCLRWLRRHCPTAYQPALDVLTIPVGHRAPTLTAAPPPVRFDRRLVAVAAE